MSVAVMIVPVVVSVVSVVVRMTILVCMVMVLTFALRGGGGTPFMRTFAVMWGGGTGRSRRLGTSLMDAHGATAL